MKSFYNKLSSSSSLFLALLFMLSGCIFEDPDCPTGAVLRFTYTFNTQYKDLFDEQVNDITLYIYNDKGEYLLTRKASADELDGNNSLYLDFPPGSYQVFAWGNLDETNFACLNPESLSDFCLELACGETGEVTDPHEPLFYGAAGFDLQDREIKQTTIDLIKNTHTIHIIMEEDLPVRSSVDRYALISGTNGSYDIRNNPITESTLLQYMAVYTSLPNGVQADFTVLRLFEDSDLELSLGWDGEDGDLIANPLVAELMKHPEINSNEDLDRWDDYTLTYTRDAHGTPSLIKINDWDVISNPGGI